MKGQLLIDWFTFSVKGAEDPDKVIREYLHMDPNLFQKGNGGLLGYQSCKIFNDIRVCYEPPLDEKGVSRVADMGICVSMSGGGCRAFEAHTRFKCKDTPFWALAELLHVDPMVNVSRVDLAIDDKAGLLDLEVIEQLIKDRQINSRFTYIGVQYGLLRFKNAGKTIYFGSKKSGFRIRVYDKAKEHFEPKQPEYNQHWVRFEMVMKGANAKGLIACMANTGDLAELAAGILNDKLAFIERDDSNITRCSLCQWWLDFLESLAFMKLLSGEEVAHTVDRIYDWFSNQLGASLSLIRDAKGIFAILDMIAEGEKKRTGKQQALLDDYRNARAGAV